ncbi:MAG: type II toxin-antitoxin system HicA family toxin [Deltaproteobacteria bacterium]|nr:type II toxin-antitoxin system HicA family toxin [Deltaproteobacteria bacterium]
MTQKEKLHEKIKNNPGNVRFDDAVNWLVSWGFTERAGKGSHAVFTHPGYNGKLTFQSVNGMAKAYQIKQALKAIKEIRHE